MTQAHFRLSVIGGGIVGLATAYAFQRRFPAPGVVIFEKEPELARHQSGHNSGVLHSGIYYVPGSLKARNCRRGRAAMQAFCEAEAIPHEICGKVIVATAESELSALERIYERGVQNGVHCELIDPKRLQELEPHAVGRRALHVPEAGIVDFAAVCRRLAQRIREAGGEIRTGTRVRRITSEAHGCTVHTDRGEIRSQTIVNCAGLHCDRVMRLAGERPEARIVPFRGEYYRLRPSARQLCRNLIYPVPDPSFPFLGVHFTRLVSGEVECGPNAVLAFSREGYRKRDISLRDLAESLSYPGFLRLAARYWRPGLGEMWRSFCKRAFLRALQRLVPDLTIDDLETAPAGVRAQALTRSGRLVDDFLIRESGRVIHVNNAPSPAATASLEIGEHIVGKLQSHVDPSPVS